jgi:hypothetical protein
MTTEDQKAIVGGLLMERADLQKRKMALVASLSKAGETMQTVASAIKGLLHSQEAPIAIDPSGVVVRGVTRLGHLPTEAEMRDWLTELDQVQARITELSLQLKPYDA